MRYRENIPPICCKEPSIQIGMLGILAAALGAILLVGYNRLAFLVDILILGTLVSFVGRAAITLLTVGAVAIVTAVILHFCISDAARIRFMVKRALFNPAYGNPLGLRNGELLPRVRCVQEAPGIFRLTILVRGCSLERIVDSASSISSAVTGRFNGYAVSLTEAGVAFDRVVFMIEDVEADKSLTFHSVEEMRPRESTKLAVQKGACIDLTTSGSMLFAGKTRSGKTTGIVALLLQVLLAIRENHNGEVLIIDPKNAELGQLPNVAVPDADGEVVGIFNQIKEFWGRTVERQKILSEKSKQAGDAVKWWDAGFMPCFLVIDEYVALRSMFPAKAEKGSDYCLSTFDGLIKRLVTMGASAGCYVIISIAEASVESGGLPAMLRSAMSTKILFRPTLPEGRLMWDSEKLKDFSNARVYNPGDAWFSSTDGIHDNVSAVHFPRMDFPVYRELGQLLAECHEATRMAPPPPCEAEAEAGAGDMP